MKKLTLILSSTLVCVSCSMFDRKENSKTPETASPIATSQPEAQSPPPTPEKNLTEDEVKIEIKAVGELADKVNTANATPPIEPMNTELKPPRINPLAEKSFGWLKNGNTRFIKGNLRADGQAASDIQRLVFTEKAHAMILAPSDSRIPPEVIFDQKLGEIYVVRNRGPQVDLSTISSLEYGAQDLKIPHLVILTTNACSRSLDAARPRLCNEEAWMRVEDARKDVLLRSEVLGLMNQTSELVVRTGVYDLVTGKVDFKSNF
ncbi:MAG: carbonic anhydrase [Pseudobdellovibrionaceae bacterium]